jgi:uncharacterized protein YbjT (DUF2867 family)
MTSKKTIVVFGSTGAQGGGLVRAILSDPNSEFKVRAVTRNANSEKAQQLAALGAEIVEADIDDKKSIINALEGAYGAFFVTFFWDHFSPEKEYAQAKSMAEAAKETNMTHVIWSTLEDTRNWVPVEDDRLPTLQGKYKVPHFDAKGEANQCFLDSGVKTTFLIASFYWENLIYFGMGPQKGPDGDYSITFPMGDKKLAGVAAEDIGKCAYGIFKRGLELSGKTVGVAGDHLTCTEMAQSLSKALDIKVTYNEVSPEQYRGFGFPGADDLGNMFQFYRDFEEDSLKVRNLAFSRSLNPELKSFDDWLEVYGKNIPLD